MNHYYPTLPDEATPDYVLGVLNDHLRQSLAAEGREDRFIPLAFDTTILAWWAALGGDDAYTNLDDLVRDLEDRWGIEAPGRAWQEVLEPIEEQTLGDLCQFIAEHADRPQVRPYRVCDRADMPAGVFLTVRSMLIDAGADPAGITPSAPLGPYARRHLKVFLGPVSQLAPGALPGAQVFDPIGVLAGATVAVGFIGLVVGLGRLQPWLAGAGLAAAALAIGGALLARRWGWSPVRVRFGQLQTFRDLARALAPAVPQQPS